MVTHVTLVYDDLSTLRTEEVVIPKLEKYVIFPHKLSPLPLIFYSFAIFHRYSKFYSYYRLSLSILDDEIKIAEVNYATKVKK